MLNFYPSILCLFILVLCSVQLHVVPGSKGGVLSVRQLLRRAGYFLERCLMGVNSQRNPRQHRHVTMDPVQPGTGG